MLQYPRPTRNGARCFGALLLAVACALATSTAPAAAGEELLAGGDFEGEFPGETAAGWLDNSRSWAELDVEYARDDRMPHGGEACQRITCTRLDSGAVQFIPERTLSLERGKVYRVRGWLRGDVGPVALQLRQRPSPYRVYVEHSIDACDAWRQVEYFWTSPLDDPKALFMVRFVSEGTLWVDDLSVQEVTEEEAARLAPPPEPGNLLANGGFDLDLANWLVGHGCDYWSEAELSIEHVEGNPCLKLTVPEGVHVSLASDVVPVAPGHPVYLSARLRASAATPVTLGTTYCGSRPELTTDWETVTAEGRTRYSPVATDHVRLSVRGPAALWIDDVVLSQKPPVNSRDRFRAAVLSDRHPLSLYHDGDRPAIRLLACTPPSQMPQHVAWSVEDFWGNTRLSGDWLPETGRSTKPLPVESLGRGWYRAGVVYGDEPSLRHESTFVILPPPERSSDVAASPFGAHFAVDPSGLALARAVGCRWLRLHPPNHTKWRIVEPREKGGWQWRDEPIRIARRAGLELVGSLDRCPPWASSAPPGTPEGGFYTGTGAWLPRSWDEWEEYVAKTVRRYKDGIHIWEVWNEPNLHDWLFPRAGQSRAEAYVEMLQHTYPIVKREDPTATVIGGCVAGALADGSSAWRFTRDIIAGGALKLMDVFSFHQYITRSVDESSEPIDRWLAKLRAEMRAAGRELPIINSEGGYANPGTSLTYRPCPANTIDADKMARWLVRQYVAQWAGGVRQFFFYNFFIDGSPTIRTWEGFLEGDGQPRPNVAAYAQMSWMLDGALFLSTDRPNENVWVHHFDTPRGPVAVAWARTDHRAELPFPHVKEAWDLMGAPVTLPADGTITITDAPRYLLLEPQ